MCVTCVLVTDLYMKHFCLHGDPFSVSGVTKAIENNLVCYQFKNSSAKIYLFAFQNQQSSTLGSSVVRYDKLDQAEIKSLLMCFLHILRSMSDGR